MKKNNEIMKLLINKYNSNSKKIDEYDSKISLLEFSKNKNKNRVVYILGLSIVISFIFVLTNKSGIISFEVSGLTCLFASSILGVTLNEIETYKYKKTLKQLSNSNSKDIKEKIIRYSIEKNNLFNRNLIIKKLYEKLKDKNMYFSNKLDDRTIDEIENDIVLLNLSEKLKEEKMDLASKIYTVNSFNYNKIEKYILSLIGVFSICYLPCLSNISMDTIYFFIKVSLIVNIPINILIIKDMVEDRKICAKLYKECEYKFDISELNLDKSINELVEVKKELINNQYILSNSNIEEKEYEINRNNEFIKEKNKVLILKK